MSFLFPAENSITSVAVSSSCAGPALRDYTSNLLHSDTASNVGLQAATTTFSGNAARQAAAEDANTFAYMLNSDTSGRRPPPRTIIYAADFLNPDGLSQLVNQGREFAATAYGSGVS